MAATFPTGVKSFGSDHINGDVIVPGDVNDLRAEVVALESLNAYVITPSIASNNLTLAIKALSGGNPSATEPISFMIAGAGHILTAALSVTVNAGTSIFNAGATELLARDIELFVYIGWRAASSTLFVLISRIPHARTYADFSPTSTNEKYGAYSGSAPASTDVVRVIGRFAAQNSGTASFNWSIPTPKVVHEPIFETSWLLWSPVHSRSGGAYTNLPTINTRRYKIGLERITWETVYQQNATPGSSGNQTYTLPFTVGNLSLGFGYNPSTGVFNFPVVVSSTALVTIKNYAGAVECTPSNFYVSGGLGSI